MIDSLEKSTKYILYALTIAKKNELDLYEDKILQLKEKMDQNPDSTVIEHKYFLAKMRYEQLKRTNQELWELDRDMLYNKRFRQISTLEVS
ncbi:hypothetical protein [uncultured Winogradskyella sp.]|uniref:hypothetical protein n=1 Tax=uncultured Winogradskyella sp. TaxID=395353 RepID=UPI002630A18D|nr:hypothetical protein [uncultured Winogradskyella sp.]